MVSVSASVCDRTGGCYIPGRGYRGPHAGPRGSKGRSGNCPGGHKSTCYMHSPGQLDDRGDNGTGGGCRNLNDGGCDIGLLTRISLQLAERVYLQNIAPFKMNIITLIAIERHLSIL